jgi:type IV pilus assembly protein PilC
MAQFVCRVGTDSGKVLNETFQAPSEEELRQRLSAQGYYVFNVRTKKAFGQKVGGSKARIDKDDFLIFNQQFLTLSKSGLPLQKSLSMLARQAKSVELRSAIETVRDRVSGGALLSEAFEETGAFPKIYCATVKAGEKSGSLDKVLTQFVAYQKARRTFNKTFVAALIYPCILIVFLIGLIIFVTTYVIPQFSSLYSSLQVPMPALTLFVMTVGMQIKKVAVGVGVALVLALLILRAAGRSQTARRTWERLKLRTPLVGKLLLKFAVAEFSRTLGILLEGGTPIVPALATARESVSNPLIAEAIDRAKEEVTSGRALSGSLRTSKLLPDLALDMIEVGETTGALHTMLGSVADFYEEDVNIDLAALIGLVGPAVLVVIAVVVAFVLVAFYLPLFSLAGQVH